MGYELLEDCSHDELMEMVVRLRAELKAARALHKSDQEILTLQDEKLTEEMRLRDKAEARIAELEAGNK